MGTINKDISDDELLKRMSITECENKGKECMVDGEYVKAQMFFNHAYLNGSLNSLYNLALCKMKLGDYVNSIPLLKRASDEGNIEATYQLAMCYEKGLGVPQNHRGAVKLLESAAAKGNQCARERLSTIDTSAKSMANYKALRNAIIWSVITIALLILLWKAERIQKKELISPFFAGGMATLEWKEYRKSLKY